MTNAERSRKYRATHEKNKFVGVQISIPIIKNIERNLLDKVRERLIEINFVTVDSYYIDVIREDIKDVLDKIQAEI